MAFKIADRVKETTTLTGTSSNINLGGAFSGFLTFASQLANGDTTYYCIEEDATNNFEIGVGTYNSSSNELARTTILKSSATNNAAVNWSSGTKTVYITVPGEKFVVKNLSDDVDIKAPDGAVLTLQTSDTTVLDGDTLGEIHFQAPDEADGSPVNDKIAKIKTSVHTRDLGEIIGNSIYTQFEFIVKGNLVQDPSPDFIPLLLDYEGAEIAGNLQITGRNTYPIIKLHSKETAIDNGDILGQFEFQAPNEADGGDADNVVTKITVDAREDFDASNSNTSVGIHFDGGSGMSEYFRFTQEFGQGRLILGDASPSEIRLGYGIDGAGAGLLSTKIGHGFVQTSAASGGLISLEKTSTNVTANHLLGQIRSKTPNVTNGGDGQLPGAAIKFLAEGTFTSTANPTAISFSCATSGTVDTTNPYDNERFRIGTSQTTSKNTFISEGFFSVGDNFEFEVNQVNGNVHSKGQIAAEKFLLDGATSGGSQTTLDCVDPTQNNTITLPDSTGQVVLSSGAIDTDATTSLGRALIHSPTTDNAVFSHVDRTTINNYALLASSAGGTFINASSGQSINFNNNNGNVASINTDGLYLNTGKTLRFEGATGNANETTLTVEDPTADRTLTLPNVNGTILTSGNSMGGELITKITASNDSSISFGSSSITDDFDYYDIVMHDVLATQGSVLLRCRFGLEGTTGVETGVNYSYFFRQSVMLNRTSGNNFTEASSFDNSSTHIELNGTTNGNAYISNLGTGGFNGHFRLHNFRSANKLKAITNIDMFNVGTFLYAGTYASLPFLGVFTESFSNIGAPQNSTKADEIQFFMTNGNIASGTFSLYGIKL